MPMTYQTDCENNWVHIDRQGAKGSCGPACMRMAYYYATGGSRGGTNLGEDVFRTGFVNNHGVHDAGFNPNGGPLIDGTHDWATTGVSLDEVDRAFSRLKLKKFQYNLHYSLFSPSVIYKLFSRAEESKPVMVNLVWTNNPTNISHWVIVLKFLPNKRSFLVLDPYYGVQQAILDAPPFNGESEVLQPYKPIDVDTGLYLGQEGNWGPNALSVK